MADARSRHALDAEVRGILVAVAALGGDVDALAVLDDALREPCLEAWANVGGDADCRQRQLAVWRDEASAAVPVALSRLHPSWCEEALVGEHRDVIAAIVAGGPKARMLARLAFAHLLPLCESHPGPLGQRLCRLSLDSLLAAITRRGAHLVGRMLTSAPASLRARAMAAVGEPWAEEILASASVAPDRDDSAAAMAAVSAVGTADGRSAPERLLHVGLAGLKAELAAEGQGSLLRVAGRLPPALGRPLVGW